MTAQSATSGAPATWLLGLSTPPTQNPTQNLSRVSEFIASRSEHEPGAHIPNTLSTLRLYKCSAKWGTKLKKPETVPVLCFLTNIEGGIYFCCCSGSEEVERAAALKGITAQSATSGAPATWLLGLSTPPTQNPTQNLSRVSEFIASRSEHEPGAHIPNTLSTLRLYKCSAKWGTKLKKPETVPVLCFLTNIEGGTYFCCCSGSEEVERAAALKGMTAQSATSGAPATWLLGLSTPPTQNPTQNLSRVSEFIASRSEHEPGPIYQIHSAPYGCTSAVQSGVQN
ncbi:unnamed protein product [Polarella glacialis]|uniref:Uncharacterized protein n=1 Tax=Polarella glacialis TaxID=89957 RepID=A0A813GQN1_POLGL|nr:unnamed protein product [Polarella glacialis]